MKHILFWLMVILLFTGCTGPKEQGVATKVTEKKEPRMVGDIPFDEAIDDPNFEVCHGEFRLVQYFALGMKTYEGEKIALDRIFKKHYDPTGTPSQSGLIRIRFIVNCEGKTGRFRIQGMNSAYEPMNFDESITSQLLEITRSLDQWKVFKNDMDRTLEYYQYLIFKIESGNLTEIMP